MIDKLKIEFYKESLEMLERNISDLQKISKIKDIEDLEDEQKQELKEYLADFKDRLYSDFRYLQAQYDGILKDLSEFEKKISE
ncbi:MAG: hypothetical protein E6Y25_05905 [Sneathia sanguinegens]|uniref:hypothetical protein n=1 Tax=Sneathia sanguinegens TaxID=40543 RepID=UPI0029081B53|nr:hypothetical protein [Sneathia sanguinegens]MCT7839561.1 hypothetical protein [Lactobacillus iners]MDU4652945.1 hypothetical protein [Sneathia sanguinegens]